MDGGCLCIVLNACFFGCVMCAIYLMSHASVLASGVCPRIRHLSVSAYHGIVVAPSWNPMRSPLIVAFGSRRVLLNYLKRHVP